MSSAPNICRGHKRLRPLVELAMSSGWTVSRTATGRLKFEKPDLPPIFTSFAASDHRPNQNNWTRPRRFARKQWGGRHG